MGTLILCIIFVSSRFAGRIEVALRGMAEITVKQMRAEPLEFLVHLTEDDEVVGEYTVIITEEDYERFGANADPPDLVKATFVFLLAREEPEMILEEFKLSDVARYFPEYPEAVHEYV